MMIRKGTTDDAKKMLFMLNQLDKETKYMMFEPQERKSSVEKIKDRLNKSDKEQVTFIIDDNTCIGGFLSVQRGEPNRIRHTAYIVIGLLQQYRGKGLGTKLFEELDKWAIENNIKRLELTVVEENILARNLYKKMGFKEEGVREKSMKIDSKYVNEIYMAKII